MKVARCEGRADKGLKQSMELDDLDTKKGGEANHTHTCMGREERFGSWYNNNNSSNNNTLIICSDIYLQSVVGD